MKRLLALTAIAYTIFGIPMNLFIHSLGLPAYGEWAGHYLVTVILACSVLDRFMKG